MRIQFDIPGKRFFQVTSFVVGKPLRVYEETSVQYRQIAARLKAHDTYMYTVGGRCSVGFAKYLSKASSKS